MMRRLVVKRALMMPSSHDLFVDTSAWGSALDDQDPLHTYFATAITAASRLKRKLVTTNYIVAELVALISTHRMRISRYQMVTAINAMKADPNIEIVHVDPTTDDEAWRLLEGRQDKEWSLVDAANFVLMGRYGMTEALTTDQHLTQAGFTRLPNS